MSTRKVGPDQQQPSSGQPNGAGGHVAVVKKYANRRLYNTATSSYVTLDELSQMVRRGEDFVVYDAKTGEDITRSVLTQIILEEDSKGRNLLPIGFLRQLISFYDDQLHAFLPRYLEVSMENFARNQEQIRGYVEDTFGRFFPVAQFEDMARQNMALFQRAASMFRPPYAAPPQAAGQGEQPAGQEAAAEAGGGEPAAAQPRGEPPPAPATAELSGQMRELESRLESLQRQLEQLSRDRPAPPAA
jgi:polyhydroxyalkanoate synthesis repressor PhaR